MSKIQNIWLTINRNCNLRCKWCYAKSENFNSEMDLKLAKELIDFFKELDIKEISLIGGEPTCYSNLLELISYIKNKNIKVCLITNGLLFSDKNYLKKIEKIGVDDINFSIKGWSKDSYIDNTGVDAFDKTIKALKNISISKINSMVSFVISYENVDYLLDVAKICSKCGIDNYYFSFENDFSILDGNKENNYDVKKISKIVNSFSEQYEELDKITDGNFMLHQSLPLCVWNKEIINNMASKDQIQTGCTILQKNGLVFDVNGYLIPCNSMHQVKLAKFNEDFNNVKTFEKIWNSKKIIDIYNRFRVLPSKTCNCCDSAEFCFGGCLSNWYNYDFYDLIREKIIKKEDLNI